MITNNLDAILNKCHSTIFLYQWIQISFNNIPLSMDTTVKTMNKTFQKRERSEKLQTKAIKSVTQRRWLGRGEARRVYYSVLFKLSHQGAFTLY